MSDKSAEEMVEVMDRFQRGLSIIPPLAVTGAWRVFSLESITEIYNAGKRAEIVEAAGKLRARAMTSDCRSCRRFLEDSAEELDPKPVAGKVGT